MEDWRETAEACLEHENALSSREVEFLEDIIENWDGDLTDAQESWLESIALKVGA